MKEQAEHERDLAAADTVRHIMGEAGVGEGERLFAAIAAVKFDRLNAQRRQFEKFGRHIESLCARLLRELRACCAQDLQVTVSEVTLLTYRDDEGFIIVIPTVAVVGRTKNDTRLAGVTMREPVRGYAEFTNLVADVHDWLAECPWLAPAAETTPEPPAMPAESA